MRLFDCPEQKAIECGINQCQLRLVHVYKPDENKIIEIITNQLEWKARTIADYNPPKYRTTD